MYKAYVNDFLFVFVGWYIFPPEVRNIYISNSREKTHVNYFERGNLIQIISQTREHTEADCWWKFVVSSFNYQLLSF